MSWSSRRQTMILSVIFLIVIVPIGIWLFGVLYNPPSCFDDRRNGDEEGIDCGGSCVLLCRAASADPIVVWSRFFEIGPGFYNVMAYVENPNPDAGIDAIPYTFKLYNQENILLVERSGVAKVKPRSITPILETGVFTDQLKPSYVEFSFDREFIWERRESQENWVSVVGEQILFEDSQPRVTASLKSSSVLPIRNLDAVVIVYDALGNGLGVSKTRIDVLPKGSQKPVYFTWPQPFVRKAARIEIIPIYENPRPIGS